MHATRRTDIHKGNKISILKPSNHNMKKGGQKNQEYWNNLYNNQQSEKHWSQYLNNENNINGEIYPIKRYKGLDWPENPKPTISGPQ